MQKEVVKEILSFDNDGDSFVFGGELTPSSKDNHIYQLDGHGDYKTVAMGYPIYPNSADGVIEGSTHGNCETGWDDRRWRMIDYDEELFIIDGDDPNVTKRVYRVRYECDECYTEMDWVYFFSV